MVLNKSSQLCDIDQMVRPWASLVDSITQHQLCLFIWCVHLPVGEENVTWRITQIEHTLKITTDKGLRKNLDNMFS